MMGQLNHDQSEFFYSFRLYEAVPDDHPVRAIDAVLDLSWVRSELAPDYPKMGRPSIDPVLMIRMLVVGYVFAIRSKRALCREVERDQASFENSYSSPVIASELVAALQLAASRPLR
jgi:transposase